ARETTLTWIGHATMLLQLKGINILTDPQYSERASPFQWTGPRRVVPPGLALDKTPPIHLVIISHDHYDSLDRPSLRKLYARKGGGETTFLVPLGLKRWFEAEGIRRVIELDWWDQYDYRDLKITAVPVQHWSQRRPFERNKTLWAGWVVQSADFRFFFAGDTGYAGIFKEIGSKLGPFDLSAIPIGAYEPRWFMRTFHVNPREAVRIHLDVRSKKSVAMHWGTFPLTDEPLDEPPGKLAEALKELRVPEEAFQVLQHGETLTFPVRSNP
ncbi:MAG: MBL fold metallo-hydrolase, partial [Desulfobacterales bacterium]|nr:MBL fold metallo-hydrolase [Desulfobacterales bacterium]